jgi:lysophospholipase L1-like esterase
LPIGDARNLNLFGRHAAATATCLLALGAAEANASRAPASWISAWASAPEHSFPLRLPPGNECPQLFGSFDETIRNLAVVHAGGGRLRVRLSNVYGTAPLQIGGATVASAARGSGILPRTLRTLRFEGRTTVEIPSGSDVLSDVVRLRTAPLRTLAVSVHVDASASPTIHLGAPCYAAAGEHVADRVLPAAARIACSSFATAIEVRAGRRFKGAVVAVGDSLTDGAGKFGEPPLVKLTHRTYPDFLARRLLRRDGPALSVVNAGRAGDRLLESALTPAGYTLVTRFARDVLSQRGVTDVILQAGINDLGLGASAREVTGALRALVARAHAAGLRIYGGTLTPFRGAGQRAGNTDEQEAARRAVNRWIGTRAPFDGVFDFDAALRDPRRRDRLLPRFDAGDHLHLSPAGYRRMAGAVDLRELIASR